MASIVELNKKNTMPLASAIDRQFAIPVDSTLVWYDYDELVAYAQATDTTAYVGQIVAYVNQEEHKAYAYVIQEDGSLGEIGGGAAKNVDGISIELNENGVIGLYGYGKQYYKYRPASGVQGSEDYVESGYDLTDGWIAGLEPRVVAQGDKMILGWYEPSTETIDGLNSAVGTLGTSVENLNTSVGNLNTSVGELREDVESLDEILNGGTNDAGEQVTGLVTRVDNLESTVKDLTSAFVFKGVVAKFSDLAAVVDPQNGWVYKVTDTEAEYVFDGEYWVELGTVYEVDLTDYAKKSDITNALADYVTNDALNTALADYVTNDALNTALADYVTEEAFATLAGRVGTLEEALAEGGRVDQLEDQIAELETVIGTPATDEAEATGLIGQIGSLEELLGAPAQDGAEATGIYKVIDDLTYVAKVKVGETVLEPDADRQVELPIFGNSAVGLVPVAEAEGLTADNGANYFLNATGAWAIPVDARIGELKYNDAVYATVEAYIEAYVADHGMVWEPI